MKKSEYWQMVRNERAQGGSSRKTGNPEIIAVNDEGLATYAHDYWKKNGVLPEDYMPITGKEESGQVLRRMWEIVEIDPSFQTAVLEAYEKYYLVAESCNVSNYSWYSIWNTDNGVFSSEVEAPQLRRIIQKAIRFSEGYKIEKQEIATGLMYLCLEYCRLKSSAVKYEGRARALFNNADLLSLISNQDKHETKEVGAVLGMFEDVRVELGTRIDSSVGEDLKTFIDDILPILVGRLMKEAKTFIDWQKVFIFAKDQLTKIFALYHMSDKAKSLKQMVDLYFSAEKTGLLTVAESAKGSWKDLCSKMEPVDLMKLPPDLRLDRQFLEDLILQKCED